MTAITEASRKSHRESQRALMARKRQADRDLTIPRPADRRRRRRGLRDVYAFFNTYAGHVFWQGFNPDRERMIDAILHAARYSGDQSIAGPRGEGKTRIALWCALFLMLRLELHFPIVIQKSAVVAGRELTTFKGELEHNRKLAADFPEICLPIRSLGGWASRARMQTVAGEPTRMEWASDHIILPTVDLETLRSQEGLDRGQRWRKDDETCAGGQILASLGIEGPIRGMNFRGIRPDLALIDDVDDRESAASPTQTETREHIIDQDIAGLSGPGQRISRVMLCTLINHKCVAATYTDRSKRPSWKGERFGLLVQKPERADLWDHYIDLRRNRDPGDDPDAREAHRYYLEHRELMDAGAAASNPARYVTDPLSDGEPAEVSALQHCYDLIADLGWDNFATEYQNDPPEEEEAQTLGLTSSLVAKRLHGLEQYVVPNNAAALTLFVDLGKYRLHYTTVASLSNTGSLIVDYGVWPVAQADVVGVEAAILASLRELRDHMRAEPYVTEHGEIRAVDAAGVDAGNWNTVAYQFVREAGAPWRAVAGPARYYHPRKAEKGKRPGYQLYDSYQSADRIWVVTPSTEYWKGRVHEGFAMEPRHENGDIRPGSLTLFGDAPRTHQDYETGNFARQIMAEQWREEPPKGGKAGRVGWFKVHQHNHYLDCAAGALALASLCGIVPVGAQASRAPSQRKPRSLAEAMGRKGRR